mgnify:CR=1 FL=1|tara:strand:+ start:8857 stop:9972 length:1116 start_codon:yes stop_codon:yes gene_type:complete
MIKSLYAVNDTSIYEQTGSMNAGMDPLLELQKVSSSAGVFTSRILIQFPLDAISSSCAEGTIVNPKFYLNLYQTDTEEVPVAYTLIAYPVSQSWNNGVGKKLDPVAVNLFDNGGASWVYRDKQHHETPYLATKDIQWTSRSLHVGSNMIHSSVTGGGTWFKDYYGTQSFSNESADVRMDVTPAIMYLISESRVNDGLILMRSGSQETNGTSYGVNRFFSRETNTVYQPKLEVVYDDSSFISTGLTELTSEQSVVYLKNLKHEYSQKEIPKLRIVGRDRYPVKTFSTQSNYKNIKFLPTSSYYGVKDALTEEYVIPYSNLGTKLSCDTDGNYIKLDMNSFMPERYYKMCFQVTQSDSSVVIYDENFYFKVNR